MITRREIASVFWYGLLFSAVVVWAAMRPSNDASSPPRGALPAALDPDEPLDRSQHEPEMRRVIQHMIIH
jgi:hypothetical protein